MRLPQIMRRLADAFDGGAGETPAAPVPRLSPATRERVVTPPPPVPPPELVTGNTVGATVERPDLIHPDPRIGLVAPAPTLPEKSLGLIGGDVDPRAAGMGTRPRVAKPLEFRANRLAEMEAEPAATSHHGRLYEMGAGAWRGFQRGGLLGLLVGAGMGAADPDSIARMRQQEHLGRERGSFARLLEQRKAVTDLRGDELANDYKAAQIPYLLAKPELEQDKLDSLNEYRAGSLGLRREANESLQDYRNRTLGQRKAANESLDEYRDRMVALGERRATQGDRRITETERHNRVNESLGGERVRQGDERIAQGWEGLSLRERIANGNLDVSWARVGQGYDRIGADRQKQVDSLAEKAAKANAEAQYFEETAAGETDTAKKAAAVAGAKQRRALAEEYRRQAEAITARPAPQVSRPAAGPSSGRFAGQRMPRANLPAAAKRLGLSEADAAALIQREGGVIY